MKIATLLMAALAALCLAAPAEALDIKNMTAGEKAAFDAEVRAYLLENPEVLVEAIDKLQARQAAQQAASDASLVKTNAKALFDDPNSWVSGNPQGDVTLVEFMDYRCGYCRKAYGEVNNLVKTDGNIRYIVKEFPILGPQSLIAARFAIAVKLAAGPTVYAQAHDALMTLRGEVNDATLTRLAEKLGLDAKDILGRMDSPEVTKVIADNHALGARLKINGTPTFVLGDELLRGYVPGDQMAQLVKQVRAN